MNHLKHRYLLIIFISLCVVAPLLVFSFDAFAMGEASKGRKIWDTVLLWINFGILVFFFIKYAKNPLVNFLQGERKKMEQTLGHVDSRLQEAKSNMDREADKLKELDHRLQDIRQSILSLGQSEKERIVEDARRSANRMIEDVKGASQYRLVIAKKQINDEMVDIAVSTVEERLKGGISSEDNKRLFDQFISSLSSAKTILS